MSGYNKAIALYEPDSDEDSSMGGSGILAEGFGKRRESMSDVMSLDSELFERFQDVEFDEEEHLHASAYNPAGLSIRVGTAVNIDGDSDDDGKSIGDDPNYQAITQGRADLMAGGRDLDEQSIGSDDDFAPAVHSNFPKTKMSYKEGISGVGDALGDARAVVEGAGALREEELRGGGRRDGEGGGARARGGAGRGGAGGGRGGGRGGDGEGEDTDEEDLEAGGGGRRRRAPQPLVAQTLAQLGVGGALAPSVARRYARAGIGASAPQLEAPAEQQRLPLRAVPPPRPRPHALKPPPRRQGERMPEEVLEPRPRPSRRRIVRAVVPAEEVSPPPMPVSIRRPRQQSVAEEVASPRTLAQAKAQAKAGSRMAKKEVEQKAKEKTETELKELRATKHKEYTRAMGERKMMEAEEEGSRKLSNLIPRTKFSFTPFKSGGVVGKQIYHDTHGIINPANSTLAVIDDAIREAQEISPRTEQVKELLTRLAKVREKRDRFERRLVDKVRGYVRTQKEKKASAPPTPALAPASAGGGGAEVVNVGGNISKLRV